MENPGLNLLEPAPEEKLANWLNEFYGKAVRIDSRQLLRHRDFSIVERLQIADALPESLIYKQVISPWDVEQDLLETVLIPSVTCSPQLYMTAYHAKTTALFIEDLGSDSLTECGTAELATSLGAQLAKMHRSYQYRTDELLQTRVLQTLFPIDYEEFARQLAGDLGGWNLLSSQQGEDLQELAGRLAVSFAGEPTSLVHGDLYAENLIVRKSSIFILDWSWFTHLGVPMMDLATLTMDHFKNGSFTRFRKEVIEAYCFESGRDAEADVIPALPAAEALSRLFFLHWLVVRRKMGIMGTTAGHVDEMIAQVLEDLSEFLNKLPS